MINKKILHVISSLKVGGAEQILFDILESLKDNFEHEVVFFHDGPVRKRIEELGIKTTKITGLINIYDPIFLYRFVKKTINFKPDLISSSLWAANLLSRIFGKILKIPVINAIHALPIFEGKFRNKIDNISLKLATKVISVGETVSQELILKSLVNEQDLVTIQNGINYHSLVKKFKDFGLDKNDLGFKLDNIIIGNVGRFIKAKNQDLLIQAFKNINIEYPHTRLLLVGVGPEEQNLRDLAKGLGIENFVTFIVGQPAYKYLTIMDIFALPSKFEGLPIALLEAMACGLPTIVTGKNNSHEIINPLENGLIIETDNINQLSHAIIKLILNPELKNKLALNGQNHIQQNYNITLMTNKYRNLFNKLS